MAAPFYLATPENGWVDMVLPHFADWLRVTDRQAITWFYEGLPQGTPLDAAFNRMRSDRQEEAETIRAGGRRDAQIIRAEAEANAARIYAEAYNQDPDFYDFFRAMQSYRTTFETGEGESSIIMSPDNEYLRQFRNPGR